jgi:hypothetical protein
MSKRLSLFSQPGAFLGAMYGEEENAQKRGLSGDALPRASPTTQPPDRRWTSSTIPLVPIDDSPAER